MPDKNCQLTSLKWLVSPCDCDWEVTARTTQVIKLLVWTGNISQSSHWLVGSLGSQLPYIILSHNNQYSTISVTSQKVTSLTLEMVQLNNIPFNNSETIINGYFDMGFTNRPQL